ncbi:hypothetical protein [Calidifontibacter indicus]|uniref:hypothetical protein n=1 Tax=Calidifontibacter indicus TaxID=419650 RepID=UPI003D72D70C
MESASAPAGTEPAELEGLCDVDELLVSLEELLLEVLGSELEVLDSVVEELLDPVLVVEL